MEHFIYIIVGVVVGIVILLLLICCCCCKKQKITDQSPKDDANTKIDTASEDVNPEHSTVSIAGKMEDNVPKSPICSIENIAKYYRDKSNSTHSLNENAHIHVARRDYKEANNSSPEDDIHRDTSKHLRELQKNISSELLSHRSDGILHSLELEREGRDSVFAEDCGSEFNDGIHRKNSHFRRLVSNEVRDELNTILKQDSTKNKQNISNNSSNHVYPSQLKEVSNITQEMHPNTEKNTRIPLGIDIPRIPQPDYGMQTSTPNYIPYKRREFKGPYGADDLDDMNNPYTMKRGKQKRPSIK